MAFCRHFSAFMSVKAIESNGANYLSGLDKQTGEQQVMMWDSSGQCFRSYSGPSPNLAGQVSPSGWNGEYKCVLGLIRLLKGYYVISVKRSIFLGSLFPTNFSDVYQVASVALLSLPNPAVTLSKQQEDDEKKYINLILEFFNAHSVYGEGLFYSYTFDITATLQQAASITRNKEYWDTFNKDFWFTEKLNDSLMASSAIGFVVPCIRGVVNLKYTWNILCGLISRQRVRRCGTRFVVGSDMAGNTSAFVETEQILVYSKTSSPTAVLSYVVVRGSATLELTKRVTMSNSCDIRITVEGASNPGMIARRHLESLKLRYSPEVSSDLGFEMGRPVTVFLNCIEPTRQTAPIIKAFASQLEALAATSSNSETVYLEIAQEKDLAAAATPLRSYIDDIKFNIWSIDETESAKQTQFQRGVVRVTCLDCIDRTNVAQRSISSAVLLQMVSYIAQVRKSHVASVPAVLHADLVKTFGSFWDSNGDAMAILFAGTPSMKGNGVRRGYISMKRYFNQMLFDCRVQDAITLLIGDHSPDLSKVSPLRFNGRSLSEFMVKLFWFSIFMSLVNITAYCYDQVSIWGILIWVIVSMTAAFEGVRHGDTLLINRPVLYKERQSI